MVIILGYEDLVQIYDSDNSRVYRARRVEDHRSVILKILKADYPTPDQLRRYRQEYHLTHQLHLPNVIKAEGLEEWQRTLVMILEDFGAISLKQWLKQNPHGLTIEEFLSLALKITEGLGQLHRQAIIHKDINPANIVLNLKTRVLKLIDLGISTQLSRENPTLQTPNALEGTLPYLSPEQTGRMNRALDYRTDFYSLGVTLYELLTGTLPFNSRDPMELVHCHIAKQPVPPHWLGQEIEEDGDVERSLTPSVFFPIPKVLSAMIMKLMAKNAEDRYQSTQGFTADLEECRFQWETTGKIIPFPLGRDDISDRFQIPQKLYGREQEIAVLLEAFGRVASPQEHRVGDRAEAAEVTDAALTGSINQESAPKSAAELILVTGYSGIGKSALVQELYKPITAKRGYFVSGKFDQFQRNIPYSAVVDAFASLVKQLLGEPEPILQQWRDRLLAALGSNGQVVIDVIPEVELIIGSQPPALNLGAIESQNRFNLVFQRFIRAFCSVDHPLVIFLDDLQWADLATLSLIERLLGDSSIAYLLVIGAYRNNEVSASHPLTLTIAQLRRQGTAIEQITLAPLRLEQIGQLIAETLHSQPAPVKRLAELVMYKTEGNPFFTNEFLKTLHSENLLAFNRSSRQWQWNLVQIEARGFTDNVIDLMVGQLQKLPQSVQAVLSLAAYLGAEFNLETLALVSNRSTAEVFEDLEIAMAQGFLQPRSQLDQNLLIQDYQFGHDRIQQAAYSLISASDQTTTHYQIGQLLLQQWSPKVKEDQIFAVVNHLNHGRTLIADQAERDQLVQLNLSACRKARAATAYQAAREYAEIGLMLLGSEAWQHQYETTLTLHELATEAALLCGEFDQVRQWTDAVIDHAHTPVDQVSVYIIKIQALVPQNRVLEAIASGQSILKQLGVQFSEDPTFKDIQQAVQEITALMGDRAIADLFDLPAMKDPTKLAIMQIAASIVPSCHHSGSSLFPLLVALLVKLSIQYGNSPASAVSYAAYGSVLNVFFQDVTNADQFARLAYRLASIADAKNIRAETFAPIAFHLYPRKSHLQETLPICQAGYQAGLETGKLEHAGYNASGFCLNAFWCGQPLVELAPQVWAYRQQLLDCNQIRTANYCLIIWEATLFLLDSPDQIEISFGQETLVAQLSASKDIYGLFIFYLHRAILKFLVGEIAQATDDAARIRSDIAGSLGSICEAGLYFYDSLITLAPTPASQVELDTQQQRVQENQAQLHHWAEHAPMNYLHKWQLVEAEKCRVMGQNLEAMELYDLAIAGARTHHYLQEEALANELAAKFYLSWGKDTIARAYMVEAHYGYLRWGATAKINQLETQYPQLCQSLRGSASSRSLTPRKTVSTDSSNAALDLTTVMKSSQAIASEIVLENLLQTLMQILLENAGAQTGCLLLATPTASGILEKFSIAAFSSVDAGTSTLSPSPAIGGILPESILHYVARTHDNVLLDHAAIEGNFVHDPYIQSVKPLSILCSPLVDQGNLVGIIYLENNVTTGAFTTDRIKLLQVLSGQAAIAITNAQLYAKVRDREQQLKQFLEAVPIGIAVLDANGTPYYVNQRAEELLGRGIAPEATTEQIAQVYQIYIAGTNNLYPNDQLPVVRALKGEASSVNDIEIHQGDRLIPLESWGTPIYTEAGHVRYAITAFQDITQRKQAEKILTDYNRMLEQQVAKRTAELQHANQELSQLATLDGLTHIANRRRFDHYLEIEWRRHRREQQPLALIMIDIDYFKRYNDHYGHQAGDDCLIRVAQTIAQVPQRPTDLVARYGGEEFGAILLNTDMEGALIVAEAMRMEIAALAIPHAKSEVSQYVTLSLGVTSLIPTLGIRLENLIANADHALYAAKHQGRDRAIAHRL